MKFTKEEAHKMAVLASEILTKIHREDKSGKLLYLFCIKLCALSRLLAYRTTMDDEYKFIVITEDEYKKLKSEKETYFNNLSNRETFKEDALNDCIKKFKCSVEDFKQLGYTDEEAEEIFKRVNI